MNKTFKSRLVHAWNVFMDKDDALYPNFSQVSYTSRPDKPVLSFVNKKNIVAALYNRLALDVCEITIQHVRLDESGRFLEVIDSGLNQCFNLEANIDQTGRAFIQDVVISMLDEGCVAIVPIDTTSNPKTGSFDVKTMRTGKILEWYPQHVKVRVYNDRTGIAEEKLLLKRQVAIIENPLYAVLNEPNSTMQRLIRKLSLLDMTDEQTASGKLNLIIQLPYVVKSELRKKQAETRRTELEDQLANSKYGIAYADGTEKIIQLNRSLDNNLMAQVEYLTNQVFSQIGMTQEILNGTADEATMLNYYNRSVEPLVSAIVDNVKRTFLSKTARSQRQSIMFFRDPFKLVPVAQLAEISDKFTRNEIATSNEMRQSIGWKPSKDPKADELRNKNLSEPKDQENVTVDGKRIDDQTDTVENNKSKKGKNQNGVE